MIELPYVPACRPMLTSWLVSPVVDTPVRLIVMLLPSLLARVSRPLLSTDAETVFWLLALIAPATYCEACACVM